MKNVLGLLRHEARTLRHRVAPGAAILLYHRVADLDFDPQLLAVRPSNFAAHLEILRELGTPAPLTDLPGAPRGTFAVTFDDGYADNLAVAKPILERFEIPATVFVASGYCESGHEFWWDELERILLMPGSLPEPWGDYTTAEWQRHREWNAERTDDPTPRHAAFRAISSRMRSMPVAERERQLAELRTRAGTPATARPTHRPMTFAELSRLGGLVTLGAHTRSHPMLSALGDADQREEIDRGRRDLEAVIGRPVRTFAYPFGGERDYSATSVRLARELGFDLACSNFSGGIWHGTDRFELPRFLVRDWSADEFRARMRFILGAH